MYILYAGLFRLAKLSSAYVGKLKLNTPLIQMKYIENTDNITANIFSVNDSFKKDVFISGTMLFKVNVLKYSFIDCFLTYTFVAKAINNTHKIIKYSSIHIQK